MEVPSDFQHRLEQTTAALHNCRQCDEAVNLLAEAVISCLKSQQNKIVCFGNGGSAAQAMHFSAELVGRFRAERVSLPAIALNADDVTLTAIGNDYGFEKIFDRQVEALVNKDDLVIGLSTSGSSPNVLNGLKRAHSKKAVTALLTSALCHEIPTFVDICVRVPETNVALAQEAHLVILHWICEQVDNEMSKLT